MGVEFSNDDDEIPAPARDTSSNLRGNPSFTRGATFQRGVLNGGWNVSSRGRGGNFGENSRGRGGISFGDSSRGRGGGSFGYRSRGGSWYR